jgi:hypothetical protein
MDNPATLLTAIMFVTVLGMAIGNLLMTCAEVTGGLRQPSPSRLHLSWMVLLLLAMLSLFWETTLILDVPDWTFLDFLYVIIGPMLLLFASSVLIAPAADASASPDDHYFGLSGRFFTMLAAREAWLVGLDLRFDSMGLPSLISMVLLVLFAVLALSRNQRIHIAGNVIAWAGFIAPLLFQFLTV